MARITICTTSPCKEYQLMFALGLLVFCVIVYICIRCFCDDDDQDEGDFGTGIQLSLLHKMF